MAQQRRRSRSRGRRQSRSPIRRTRSQSRRSVQRNPYGRARSEDFIDWPMRQRLMASRLVGKSIRYPKI